MRQRESRPRLLQAILDAFSLPDLRFRILFTLAMLVVFRFVAHVPVPGVDAGALEQLFEGNQFWGMLDLFSGGAMRYFSVAAMGVYPYITASIIMMLLVPVIPRLRAISREGEAGREKINLYTHWLTVPLAALQGYGQLVLMQRSDPPVVTSTGPLSTAAIVLSLTAGTMFLVWLGELITERGIGNGISIIIFGGIVTGLPEMVGRGLLARDQILGLSIFILLGLATIAFIVYFIEAHRRIPVQYSRSLFRGGRMYRQSGTTHIPLRVNTAGMIPLIFAMSVMILPGTIASYFADPNGSGFAVSVANFFQGWTDSWYYWVIYFALVVGFTFFYTMVIFQQQNLAETLQHQGGFVPGIRPGRATEDYLNRVIMHITWGGAFFLAMVAVMPFIVQKASGVQVLLLSSTGVLIMVGVALDTMKQLEAQLLMRRYEGFLR